MNEKMKRKKNETKANREISWPCRFEFVTMDTGPYIQISLIHFLCSRLVANQRTKPCSVVQIFKATLIPSGSKSTVMQQQTVTVNF